MTGIDSAFVIVISQKNSLSKHFSITLYKEEHILVILAACRTTYRNKAHVELDRSGVAEAFSGLHSPRKYGLVLIR